VAYDNTVLRQFVVLLGGSNRPRKKNLERKPLSATERLGNNLTFQCRLSSSQTYSNSSRNSWQPFRGLDLGTA